MKNIDLTNVKESTDIMRPQPDGYICRIENIWDFPEKEYLKVEFDIAAGALKGCFDNSYKRFGNWPITGTFYQSYKDNENILSMFKNFVNSIEKSNDGFKYGNDESQLIKKYIGIILREEEYVDQKTGEVKVSLKAHTQKYSIDDIKTGNFKIPPLKKYTPKNGANNSYNNYSNSQGGNTGGKFEEINTDEDLPF